MNHVHCIQLHTLNCKWITKRWDLSWNIIMEQQQSGFPFILYTRPDCGSLGLKTCNFLSTWQVLCNKHSYLNVQGDRKVSAHLTITVQLRTFTKSPTFWRFAVSSPIRFKYSIWLPHPEGEGRHRGPSKLDDTASHTGRLENFSHIAARSTDLKMVY